MEHNGDSHRPPQIWCLYALREIGSCVAVRVPFLQSSVRFDFDEVSLLIERYRESRALCLIDQRVLGDSNLVVRDKLGSDGIAALGVVCFRFRKYGCD